MRWWSAGREGDFIMQAGWKWIMDGEGGIRSLWRILTFSVLFVGLLFAGLTVLGLMGIGTESLPLMLFWNGAVMLAAAVAAGWIVLDWLDGRGLGALGFGWTAQVPRELAVGMLIGVGSLAAVMAGLILTGAVVYESGPGSVTGHIQFLALSLVVFAIPAAAEEALFRGYPFQALVQGAGPVAATLLSSIAFSLVHYINPGVGWFALFNIFLAGVLFCVAYLRTRSLWLPTAVHLGWNWAMASVFALPVSGLAELRPELYRANVPGAEWATGGEFGPEGGVAATLAFLLALALVIWWPGLGEPQEMQARRPLVDQRLKNHGW